MKCPKGKLIYAYSLFPRDILMIHFLQYSNNIHQLTTKLFEVLRNIELHCIHVATCLFHIADEEYVSSKKWLSSNFV